MANIWEKASSILAGNLNPGLSYLITTVKRHASFMNTTYIKNASKVMYSWFTIEWVFFTFIILMLQYFVSLFEKRQRTILVQDG